MYYLSVNKIDFIKKNFFQQSFEGRKASYEKFKELTSSPQLHYLANIYNWDDGPDVLNWVIDSPLCDFGTALLIFWRAEPSYYTKYSSVSDAGYDGEVLHLLLKIISKYKSGHFKYSKIKYDPTTDGADVNEVAPNAKWVIPNEFKKVTPGRRVITKELIDGFLLFFKRYFKEIKRQRNRKKRKKQKK